MKVELHVLRYGNPDWMPECAASLDAWVERHKYPLTIWTDKDQKPAYPHPKFCMVDMWKQFAESDSEWMLYVDSDIYVRHDTPAIESLLVEWENWAGCLISKATYRTNGRFSWWCERYRPESIPELPARWWLRNGGWMVIDKKGVEKLLRVVEPPYHEGTMDECQLNYWLLQAHLQHGFRVMSPPREWHRYHYQSAPGWMWHIARKHNKMQNLERIKREGKV